MRARSRPSTVRESGRDPCGGDEGGIFKAELILNEHTPPPPDHVFYNTKDVGIGVTGSYEGDEAELTGTALVGKRSLAVHVTLRKLYP